MKVFDWGQRPCYKCGSKARVRTVSHPSWGELYDVHCTNPECGCATSRSFIYRHDAVDNWNRKPTVTDLFFEHIVKPLMNRSGKNTKKEK